MLLLLDAVEKGEMIIQQDQIIEEEVETLAMKVAKGKE